VPELARVGVVLAGRYVDAEVAARPADRSRGLSRRPRLDDDEGMLFLFDSSRVRGFVMDGMRFALDFVFLDQGVVVDLLQDVPPGELEVLYADHPFDAALEVPAGFVRRHGVRLGDPLRVVVP